MKSREVTINLISTQRDGDEKQTTELFTKGKLAVFPDKLRIFYEESEATGFEGSITTLDVYGQEKVIMERKGSAQSQLIIEKGKKHFCRYGTPYGDFTIGVSSGEIDSSLNEKGGKLRFCYVLDINSSLIGSFQIDIEVKTTEGEK